MDHGPVLAGQPVEQRRLPHVGAAYEGHPHDAFAWLLLDHLIGLVVRESGHQTVQKIACTAPVEGAHRDRFTQAQRHELPYGGLVDPVVDLVGHQHNRSRGTPQQRGHPGIIFGHAHRGIHHEQHRIGIGDSPFALTADLLV